MLYIDIDKEFRISKFENILKTFNENLEIVN